MKTKDLIKHVNTHGIRVSKEKLIEYIKKSPLKEFSISSIDLKLVVAVIQLS